MSWRKKRLLVVRGRACGDAVSPTYVSEIVAFGVLSPVAKAEGWKKSSRSFWCVIVIAPDEAEVILHP